MIEKVLLKMETKHLQRKSLSLVLGYDQKETRKKPLNRRRRYGGRNEDVKMRRCTGSTTMVVQPVDEFHLVIMYEVERSRTRFRGPGIERTTTKARLI